MPSDASVDETHEAAPDGIMHVSLPFGDSVLMGSDAPPGSGDYFGSFTDRYGIRWMVDVGAPEPGQPTG